MKLDRLISILVLLLRRERMQAKELASMFDVSVRTILRDIDAINLAGIPIVTYQGMNGGIAIAEGFRLDRSVLTEGDMVALLSTLRGLADTMPDHRHRVLMEKFKNTLSSTQLEQLNTKVNQLIIDPSPWGAREEQREKIADLRKAIEELRLIEVLYTDTTGKQTLRRLEPYSLVLKGQKWYLYAWCHLRQDFRIFKLSRLREWVILAESFRPRAVSPEQLPWEREWQSPKNMIALELLFEKELQPLVEEFFSAELRSNQDGKFLVKARFPENNWLYGFLLSFGIGVEVISPPHIREVLAEMALGIYQKYSQNMPDSCQVTFGIIEKSSKGAKKSE